MCEEIRRVTAGVDGTETRQDASSTAEDGPADSMSDGTVAGLPAVGSAKAGGAGSVQSGATADYADHADEEISSVESVPSVVVGLDGGEA